MDTVQINLIIIVLFFLTSFEYGSVRSYLNVDKECNCGNVSEFEGRVLGGSQAQPNEMQYIGAIKQMQTDVYVDSSMPICTVTILSPSFVITTPFRCLQFHFNFNIKKARVIAGGNLNVFNVSQPNWRTIQEKIVHPNFTEPDEGDGAFNSVALLRLNEPFVLGDKFNIRAVCMARIADEDLKEFNQPYIGAGYGIQKRFDSGKPEYYDYGDGFAKWINLQTGDCDFKEEDGQINITNEICLRNEKGALCNFDYGGPLLKPFNGGLYLVGLYSRSLPKRPTCEVNLTLVYFLIHDYIDWLLLITGEDVCPIAEKMDKSLSTANSTSHTHSDGLDSIFILLVFIIALQAFYSNLNDSTNISD